MIREMPRRILEVPGRESQKLHMISVLVTGQLAATLLCFFQSLESRDFPFSSILLAPVRKSKLKSLVFFFFK